jgi:type I restriction enzyme S subunit
MNVKAQFKRKKVHELCDVTSSKRIFAADYQPSGVPFFRGKEIGEKFHKREVSTELFISREKFESIRNKHGSPVDGDLLLTSIGALLGSPYVVKDEGDFYFKDGNLTWFRNFEGLGSKYLYYWLQSHEGKAQLDRSKIGAAQPAFTITKLKEMEINLPSLPTQRKIAGILSTYDDLIENNLRRISILEEMAQSLYREWFVHFRFPGHEDVAMVDSPLGPIPEGWEVKKVEDAVKRFSVGKKYNNKTVEETGAVPVLDQGKSGIIGYHNNEPGFVASEDEPVIVFANHTCYQRIIQYPFSAIQNVLPFRSSPSIQRNLYWLHWATKDVIEFNDYKGHWPEFIAKKLIIPPVDVCDSFGRIAETSIRSIYCLERRNQNLRQTRDLLLPKLLSPS